MTLRRRQSVEERRRSGLATLNRVGALGEISDPRLRRAMDALTSPDNFDLDMLDFTSEGRLTVREDAIQDVVDRTAKKVSLDYTTQLAHTPSRDDAAIRVADSVLRYTQLPSRVDLATTATSLDVIARLNEILEDQRRAGHRARGDSRVSASGAALPDFTPVTIVRPVADYTALLTDEIILGDATALGVNLVISLPPVSTASGKQYYIAKVDGVSVNIRLDPDGSELVNGAATHDIGVQYTGRNVYCDGSVWWAIS